MVDYTRIVPNLLSSDVTYPHTVYKGILRTKKKPIIEINYHDFHYLNLTWQSTELWKISHKVEDRDRSRHRPLSSEDLDYADDLGLLSNRHQDIQQTLTLLSVGLDFFLSDCPSRVVYIFWMQILIFFTDNLMFKYTE